MQVQPQLGMEPKPNQVCMMIFDPDSVLVIFLHTNLAWFGLCFDLRSNLHAARKLTWMYMGINLQARVFFCFFLFRAVGATFSMRFRRSAGQNTQDWPCAVGCRTRGHTRPGPRAFRAKSGRPYCRINLQARFFFCFVLFCLVLGYGFGFFDAVSTERRPEHPRLALRRWLPHPGPYSPGPARFPGEKRQAVLPRRG